MTAEILKGKEVTEELLKDLKARAEKLETEGIKPCLAIIRVGENPGDISYEKGALSKASKVGVEVKKYVLSGDVGTEEVLDIIDDVNGNDKIHGILVFRPMPKGIDDEAVRNAIKPEKDMDGVTDGSLAGVFTGKELGYPPCTAMACMELLDYYNIPVEGKKAVVIGRSLVIGRPVAIMLMKKNATVTICHTRTEYDDLKRYCKEADIIVAAAGSIGTVTGDLLSDDQIILDVGVNMGDDGKMTGDVIFEEAVNVAAGITPVPGGIGGITSTILMKHVIEAAEKAK